MTDEDKNLRNLSRKSKSQLNNEENNPCYKEQCQSLDCMSRNNYDGQQCQMQFENYKSCKSFWQAVKSKRRIAGIRPYLPPLDERKTIKESYLKTGKF